MLAAAAPSGGSILPGLMMAAGVALLTLWALLRLRQRLNSRGGQRASTPAGGASSDDRLRQADRAAIDSLMVDAEELTRRLAAHMENKAARLEKLIEEADQRIARLERLERGDAGRDEVAEGPPPEPVHAGAAARRPASPIADPLSRDVYRLADQGLEPLQIAQELSEQVGKVQLILALREK